MTFGTTARFLRLCLFLGVLVAALAPSTVLAQRYDLDFTLPTAGKSGCLVCHGDPNLVRMKGTETRSFFVDEKVIKGSAHEDVPCTGCHIDFAFKAPHRQSDWRRSAKLACKNCHEEQFQMYGKGVHSISVQPGQVADPKAADKPLCGDCHGSHAIEKLTKNPEGKRRLHARGIEVCGKCHEQHWSNYDDYYHGSAYRRGAPDAPACWQCHGTHEIYPSSDKRAAVHETQLVETCGQCHENIDSNDRYVSYARLVHRRSEHLDANPVYAFLRQTSKAISGFFEGLFG